MANSKKVIIDGIVILCETISTLLKNSKKLAGLVNKIKKPPNDV